AGRRARAFAPEGIAARLARAWPAPGERAADPVSEARPPDQTRSPGQTRSPAGEEERALDPTVTDADLEAPSPIAEPARRFLRAATGVDPAAVPIHRGAAAAQLASAHGADALAVDGRVVLGAGHPPQTPERPETLGLLAHELTHVAAQHRPGLAAPVP